MFDGRDETRTEHGRVKGQARPERRRWSAKDKARVVAEARAPGAVVSAVARRWQVSPQQVFAWRRKAAYVGLRAPSSEQVMADPLVPDFVPILTDAAPVQPVPAASLTPVIEVEMAGAVVRVAPGMSDALLTAVLRAIRASAR